MSDIAVVQFQQCMADAIEIGHLGADPIKLSDRDQSGLFDGLERIGRQFAA